MATTATTDTATGATGTTPAPDAVASPARAPDPAAAPPRTVLLRLESRALRAAVVAATLALAGWGAWALGGRIAGEDRGPQQLRRLAAAAQARLPEPDLDEAGRLLGEALRLRPTHGPTWLDLALLLDLRGEAPRARQALAIAVRLDPHNAALRWEAALLALRWGDRRQALDHVAYVLVVDPGRRDAAFQLARALLGPGESVARLLPAEPGPLGALLDVAVARGEVALARAVWERRQALGPPVVPEARRRYFDLLLRQGLGREARALWPALVPDRWPGAPENLAWNGSFESDRLLGWGFDWHVPRVWGVEARLDRSAAADGAQSLRLSFNAPPTLDYLGAYEYVAVEPAREYRLRARAMALELATSAGVKLQVVSVPGDRVLAETAEVRGTTPDWVDLEARVRVPGDATLVRVRVRRERATVPEGPLGGRVWIDAVSLAPAPGGA